MVVLKQKYEGSAVSFIAKLLRYYDLKANLKAIMILADSGWHPLRFHCSWLILLILLLLYLVTTTFASIATVSCHTSHEPVTNSLILWLNLSRAAVQRVETSATAAGTTWSRCTYSSTRYSLWQRRCSRGSCSPTSLPWGSIRRCVLQQLGFG